MKYGVARRLLHNPGNCSRPFHLSSHLLRSLFPRPLCAGDLPGLLGVQAAHGLRGVSNSTDHLPKDTMSSTFTLPHIDPPVTVSLVSGLSKDQLVSFPAFKTWMSTLQHSLSLQTKQSHVFYNSPYTLRGIVVQAIDYFGGGRLGFVKLKADISNASGEKLPGSVFLRGGSVCMMVRYTTESLMRT